MDLVYWLPVIILFITWAYTLYKWIKSERELNQSREEIQRYREEELKKDENNLLNNLKLEGPITQELPMNRTKRKFGERYKIDANKWLDAQKENGTIPVKQSFILKSKSGRYFQGVANEYLDDGNLIEKVMETTDDILRAKKYRTHKEANEEAIKYDFEVLALNTYVKEL
ncbi:hypothetical protein M3C31_01915 [Staphylococcus hominis]|uniref:hypothetical protein n=1 Tax=Staphylococcus hominis TaxID=1290 RepID=UPI0021A446B0|nr:hypothetical protein [Staphylococcus hominis]MCT1482605.1 hypothetical protein [Staphylococcus hominis]